MQLRKLNKFERARKKNRERVIKILKLSVDSGKVPIAWGLKVFKNSWVVQCPYCGGKHHHARHEGMRTAHCQSLCGLDFPLSYRIKVKEGINLSAIMSEPVGTDFLANKYIEEVRNYISSLKCT